MSPILFFDPPSGQHEYLTKMYFDPMKKYMMRALNKPAHTTDVLESTHNATVLCLADHLNPELIATLKNNGNKIVGFSVTDSSWISQSCRAGKDLKNVDLMFMLTGIQKVNTGRELIVTPDLKFALEERTFLPDEDWGVFHGMHIAGRLQSLPYVHWERQDLPPAEPYLRRSQKVLMRGGHHMRRFLLALQFLKFDLLDCNSGFVTAPYFRDDMNPQFRYCDECRADYKKGGYAYPIMPRRCINQNWNGLPGHHDGSRIDLSDLGSWNNTCPTSMLLAAQHIGHPLSPAVVHLMNARWLPQREHLEMLARITFTSDLKWLFSIYAAQRFWDAASVGCINLLPSRTADQDYFPRMDEDVHYFTFDEKMDELPYEAFIDERQYGAVAQNAKRLYDQWMCPTEYAINTNLLAHIFQKIEEHCA